MGALQASLPHASQAGPGSWAQALGKLLLPEGEPAPAASSEAAPSQAGGAPAGQGVTLRELAAQLSAKQEQEQQQQQKQPEHNQPGAQQQQQQQQQDYAATAAPAAAAKAAPAAEPQPEGPGSGTEPDLSGDEPAAAATGLKLRAKRRLARRTWLAEGQQAAAPVRERWSEQTIFIRATKSGDLKPEAPLNTRFLLLSSPCLTRAEKYPGENDPGYCYFALAVGPET